MLWVNYTQNKIYKEKGGKKNVKNPTFG